MKIQPIDAKDVQTAYAMAIDQMIKYENFEKEHYKNTLIGQFIGKLGEFGAYRWAQRAGLDPVPNFLTDDSNCDLFLRAKRYRCEVKTWRHYQWFPLGHALNEDQYRNIKAGCKVALWCSVYFPKGILNANELFANLEGGCDICVCGWNWICEFENIKPTEFREKLSRQITINQVRPMGEL